MPMTMKHPMYTTANSQSQRVALEYLDEIPNSNRHVAKHDRHQPRAIEALEHPIEDNAVTDELAKSEQSGREAEPVPLQKLLHLQNE